MSVDGLLFTSSENPVCHLKDLLAEKFTIRLTWVLALLVGPTLFVILYALVPHIVQDDRAWVFLAFLVIGFQCVWYLYAFAVLIHKAFQIEIF